MIRTLASRIHVIGPDEIGWPFGEEPRFSMKGPAGWAHTVKVDPFPCYGHNPSLVGEIAAQVEQAFPVAFQVDYFLPRYEATDRCNGFATKSDIWGDSREKPYPFEPQICLNGKRIPLHPAMTRYLVGHEYGHVAEYWLTYLRKLGEDELRKQYTGLRPGSSDEYGGGRWHKNVGELFANDFRILVCGLEPEFWPHPGFPPPGEVPAVIEFWEAARVEVVAAAEAREAADA